MIFSYQVAFDCANPFVLSVFWAEALGLRAPKREEVDAFHAEHPETAGRGVVQDPAFRHPRIYIQTVPEPKVGTNRIRFEVAGAADRLIQLGAVRLDDVTLADPEGNEFTVVDGDRPRFTRIVIDVLDPGRMAAFWSEALGFERTVYGCDRPPGLLRLTDGMLVFAAREVHRMFPADSAPPDTETQQLAPDFTFRQVDEPKQRKNRIHFDLNCVDTADWKDEFSRLQDLGARPVERAELNIEPEPRYWGTRGMVMRDPEHNEFCLQAVFEHEWAS